MAQWQKLILEAEQACAVNLNEETESYLVFLLMRFIEKPQMVSSVLGLEFLEGSQDFSHAREEKLRDVGDKCLLLSGLFPGRAEHRCVDISYFIKFDMNQYPKNHEKDQLLFPGPAPRRNQYCSKRLLRNVYTHQENPGLK